MFSMCSELTPRAPIPDTRIPQLMQPWSVVVESKAEDDVDSHNEGAVKGDLDSRRQPVRHLRVENSLGKMG